MLYIYFFEDGSYAAAEHPPGPQDIEAIEDGTLLVLKVSEDSFQHGVLTSLKCEQMDERGNARPANVGVLESDEYGEYTVISQAKAVEEGE